MRIWPAFLAVPLLAITVVGCAPEVADISGVTAKEALAMPLKAQYELAGDRYRELNDRFAELQREIYTGRWREGGTSSEIVPGSGFSRSGSVPGVTRENSYYFNVSRAFSKDQGIQSMLTAIESSWLARGWVVSREVFPNGDIWVKAKAENGFSFDAYGDLGESLSLDGWSPVYWGNESELSTAIAGRRDVEHRAGEPWDSTDRDEKGYAYRLPGEYRHFPDWDIPLGPGDDSLEGRE